MKNVLIMDYSHFLAMAKNCFHVLKRGTHLLALLSIALLATSKSNAAIIHVTTLEDTNDGVCDSHCSVREAMIAANHTPGTDTIQLGSGAHIITSSLPYVTDNLIFVGQEYKRVNWSKSSGIVGLDMDRIFEFANVHVEFHHIVLAEAQRNAILIRDSASVLLDNSVLLSNYVAPAITNYGDLTIKKSALFGNEGEGALHNLYPGTATIRESLFTGNDSSMPGGSIYNTGHMDIRRSAITRNRAKLYGGGIMNAYGGYLKMVNTTVSDNFIYRNENEHGGAIANGGGISYPPGSLYLTQMTIANNLQYGLYTSGYTYIKNTLLIGNVREYDSLSQNCYREPALPGGDLPEFKYQGLLIGRGNNIDCPATQEISNREAFTVILEPLAQDGPLSPAYHKTRYNIHTVDTGVAPCPSQDQRGFATPFDGDGDGDSACDIGAYEYHE